VLNLHIPPKLYGRKTGIQKLPIIPLPETAEAIKPLMSPLTAEDNRPAINQRRRKSMALSAGDKAPIVNVGVMTDSGPGVISTEEIFSGKTVALFGLPGAFTKTCSSQHLPGYVRNAAALKAKGVDSIVCLSVNDPWVMDAWGQSQETGDDVMMIADGARNFTRAAGLEVDLNDKCYGPRCKRFSALVVDGVVKTVHYEDNGFGETSAEKMLEDL